MSVKKSEYTRAAMARMQGESQRRKAALHVITPSGRLEAVKLHSDKHSSL